MINSLLPYEYQDKNNLALENCIKQIFDIDLTDIMLNPIDVVAEKLLPYLARENHILGIEGWELCKTVEEKRELLKVSLIQHMYRGTKASIENLIKTLNLPGTVKESFEYNGRPNRFRVEINTSASITEASINYLQKGINCYKSQRCIPDITTIRVYLPTNAEVYVSAALTEDIECNYDCTNIIGEQND